MPRLVDVPDVDDLEVGGAAGLHEAHHVLDDAVLPRERGRAGVAERALLADRVVLQVDDEEGGPVGIQVHALTIAPIASAISAHVPTVATFCIA